MIKRLSIITINWNDAEGLAKTVESVVSQITSNCEYIIVDGQSTDGSLEIIKRYADDITSWVSEPKNGIYADMNKGLAMATGDYCLFLNSGDWLCEGSLSRAIKECNGEDIIYFNTKLSYDGEKRFEELRYPKYLTMRSFFNRTIGHQSTLIKRDLFLKYGIYNENYKIHSDYEFWIKTIIIGNVNCKYVDQFLVYYDMNGRSSKPDDNSLLEIDSILMQHLPKRVLDDYQYWFTKEKEMQILVWYRSQPLLYRVMVFYYKVIKNISRLLSK
ncbi:hypothetical protein DYBT9275_02280 [Dyadobacter sp. CECT 9275]|uniref:Glycosyltransferase 2-like domain-containing protein n=1 Tax=Dyadobacter helix TaxID=2822344 RepID=A0A916JB12_9BACT|nr:glycosyltransferase family 2 protein [Dyadobacter sp. CECT 9275]CAG4999688.1 hypothetical protein DYBT9275_02280 [Dyadobacter sp. CECT 9275]